MKNIKLKQREIQEYREKYLKENNGVCPICSSPCTDPVLDHCHVNGNIRDTVCRECNALEGKVHNFLSRFMPRKDGEAVLAGLIEYRLRDYSQNPIHPKHKTPQEKQVAALKKRLKSAKRDSTKERLRKEIQEIQDVRTARS